MYPTGIMYLFIKINHHKDLITQGENIFYQPYNTIF